VHGTTKTGAFNSKMADKDLTALIYEALSTGQTVASSLIKLASTYPAHQAFPIELSGTILIISNLLQDLLNAIETEAIPLAQSENLIKPLVCSFSALFLKIQKALDKAAKKDEAEVGEEWEQLGSDKPKRRVLGNDFVTFAGTSTFREELGDSEAEEQLRMRLYDEKGHLWFLVQVLKYLGLKKQEKEYVLD